MDCEIARQKLFDKLDCEIDAGKALTAPLPLLNRSDAELETHLVKCAACRLEYRLISLPRAVAASGPTADASEWFYQGLCRRIEGESQCMAGRQAVWKLAYRMIPALAGITLTLALTFAWQEARASKAAPRNYEDVFIADDAARRMLAGDQNDITYKNILAALAERHMDNFSGTK